MHFFGESAIVLMINIDNIWNLAKSKLSITMPSVGAFDVWIQSLEPVCITDGKLVLAAPTKMAKDLINRNYKEIIDQAVSETQLTIRGTVIVLENEIESYVSNSEVILDDQPVVKMPKEDAPIFTSKYTFENFVVGDSNRFAVAAAHAVAENPGKKNPLFLWGGVGLGKTHLMHAIGNYIRTYSPNLRIQYVTTAEFTNELVDSIQKSKNNRDVNGAFREKYYNCDVLMIDDVQFLANRSGTQEAVFNLFNSLYINGKQIILSSDRHPKEIETLTERLESRFLSGITADIREPNIETRIAILRSKCQEENYNVEDEVLHYIASLCSSNVRELEGLLSKVALYADLMGIRIVDMELASEALGDYTYKDKEIIDIDRIIDTTCEYFKISRKDIEGPKRNREFAYPRMICVYIINNLLSIPLKVIGEALGGRDYTTIIHSRDKISQLMQKNESIKKSVNDIKNILLGK